MFDPHAQIYPQIYANEGQLPLSQEDFPQMIQCQTEKEMEELQLKKILCALLKSSDEYGLAKTTKFLARNYCLRFLRMFPQHLIHDPELVMIGCLRLAVKFNQNSQISSNYTLECCVSQSENRYTQNDFINFELKLLGSLSYVLHIGSPYDCLDEAIKLFNLKEIDGNLVETAIDYTLSLVEFVEDSGEEIFSYCVAVMFQQQKIYNLKLFNWLEFQCKRIGKLQQKANYIHQAIFGMEDQEPIY